MAVSVAARARTRRLRLVRAGTRAQRYARARTRRMPCRARAERLRGPARRVRLRPAHGGAAPLIRGACRCSAAARRRGRRALAAQQAGRPRGGTADRRGRRAAARRRREGELACGRLGASLHRVAGSRRYARDHALQRRRASSRCSARCTSTGTRCTSARSTQSSTAPTSGAAPRCRSTSPRASCGRTTWRATRIRRGARAALAEGGYSVAADQLNAALVGVEPSPIRVSADALTYPLHIILRFELELRWSRRSSPVRDLPGAWREARQTARDRGANRCARMPAGHPLGQRQLRLLPELCLGCLIAAQLWETLEDSSVRATRTCTQRSQADPGLARQARPPPRTPPGHDPAARTGDGKGARDRAVPALVAPLAKAERLARRQRPGGAQEPRLRGFRAASARPAAAASLVSGVRNPTAFPDRGLRPTSADGAHVRRVRTAPPSNVGGNHAFGQHSPDF